MEGPLDQAKRTEKVISSTRAQRFEKAANFIPQEKNASLDAGRTVMTDDDNGGGDGRPTGMQNNAIKQASTQRASRIKDGAGWREGREESRKVETR